MKLAIVGGGISGLVSGIFALKKGNEVCIFEKNDNLGGVDIYNNFTNYFIYDANIPFYKEIGIDDLNIYDNKIKDDEYLINYNGIYLYKNINLLEEHLKSKDPSSIKEIDNFIKDIRQFYQYTINYDDPIDLLSFKSKAKFIFSQGKNVKMRNKHNKENIREYVEGFKNEDIKNLLKSILPSDYPIYVLLILIAYYQLGKLFKIDNKLEIVEKLKNKYTSLGGKIRFNSEIYKFTYKYSKVVGLWTGDDKYFAIDACICTNDPYDVFKRILENKHNDRKYMLRYEDYKNYPMYSYLSFTYNFKSTIALDHDFILDIDKIKIATNTHERLKISINNDVLNVNISLNNDDYAYFKILSKNAKTYEREIDTIKKYIQNEIIKRLSDKYDLSDNDIKLSFQSYLDPIIIEKKYNHFQGNVSGFGMLPGNETNISDGRIANIKALYLASGHNSCPCHLLSKMIEAKNVILRLESDLKQ